MALTGVINTDELLRNTDPSTWEVDAPTALAVQPIHETLSNASGIVALVIGVLRLDDLFSDMLPNDFNGLIGVLENSDGQAYAYEMNGNEVCCLLCEAPEVAPQQLLMLIFACALPRTGYASQFG